MSASNSPLPEHYLIGEIFVDSPAREISFAGAATSLEPKVYAVLEALAESAGKTVARADLLDRVWSKEFGGDESLTRAISILRKSFSKAPGGRDYIVTTPKSGYRLTAPVRPAAPAEATPAGGLARSTTTRRALLPLAAAAIVCVGTAIAIIAYSRMTQPVNRRAFEVHVAEAGARTADLQNAFIAALNASGFEARAREARGDAYLRIEATDTTSHGSRKIKVVVRHKPSNATLFVRDFEARPENGTDPAYVATFETVDAVRCALTAHEVDAPRDDPDLLRFYFRGCSEIRQGAFESMLENGRQAVARTPGSDAARLYLAIGAALTALNARSDAERRNLLKDASLIVSEIKARRAGLARADYAAGLIAIAEMDWLSADKNLTVALKNDPTNPYTLNSLSTLMRRVGMIWRATDLKRRAVIADPYSIALRFEYALLLAEAGDMRGVTEQVEEIEKKSPDDACALRLQVGHWRGDAREMRELLSKECISTRMRQEQFDCARAFLDARLDLIGVDTALDLCRKASTFDPVRYPSYFGEIDRAFEIAREREPHWTDTTAFFYQEMDGFRRDPRFMQIAARYGLTEYWAEADSWPDFCAEPGFPYDCRVEARNAIR